MADHPIDHRICGANYAMGNLVTVLVADISLSADFEIEEV